jgi:ATP/maltotriose-dependent transcriptional regulator MalT
LAETEAQQLTGIAAHIIKRPRLTKILDETDARIILLCAPAGYGKTTLAREWIATRSEPVYWYSGGPAMADVAALAVDLAELLVPADPAAVERVQFLASRGDPPHRIAKALAAAIPSLETPIVLDDYQYVSTNDAADVLIRELVSQTTTRFLITSRSRPRWLSSKRVVYGEVLALSQGDLAFTRDEADRVLPGAGAFYERSQGWPAVVGLAAVTGDTGDFASEVASSELYDFLASELLAGATQSLRATAFALAAGGDQSPEVARSTLGVEWEDAVADAAAHGFVTRSAEGWMAIHPLLRVFLIRKLEDDVTARLQIIDRVLSALVQHKEWDGCLALFERFPNHSRAALVLRDALPDLLAVGRSATVERWIGVLRAAPSPDPILLLAEGELAMRRGEYQSAITLGEEAAKRLSGDLAARAHVVAARAAHQLDTYEVARRNAQRAEAEALTPELQTEAVWIAFASSYEHDHLELRHTLERLQAVPDPRAEHSLRIECARAFTEFSADGSLARALELVPK